GAWAVVSGPGGFPLLALGTHRSSRVESGELPTFGSLPALTASSEPNAAGRDPIALEPSELNGAELAFEGDGRSDETRQTSVLAGMSVAVAVMVRLALPRVSDPHRNRPKTQSRIRDWLSRSRPIPPAE